MLGPDRERVRLNEVKKLLKTLYILNYYVESDVKTFFNEDE